LGIPDSLRSVTISRRIVERHGGQLWVRPAPEQGITFYFTV
jgi:signal transduction histidine kinase